MAGVCGVHSGVVVGKSRMPSCTGLCMMALSPMRRHIGISAIANNSLHIETCRYYHKSQGSQGSQEGQEWGSIWWDRRRDERRNKVEIGIAISICLTAGYSENSCNDYCFKIPLMHLWIVKCRLSIPTTREGYKYHERSISTKQPHRIITVLNSPCSSVSRYFYPRLHL